MFVFTRVAKGPVPPGCYAQWQLHSNGFLAECCCPNGHGSSLRDADHKYPGNHRVAPDGTVSPSYVCPESGCSFHEYVKLAGWEPYPCA